MLGGLGLGPWMDVELDGTAPAVCGRRLHRSAKELLAPGICVQPVL